MSHTLSIRLTKRLAAWLEETAKRTGMSQGEIVRQQLELASRDAERPFMRLAGLARGPRDLSARKGFSKS